MKIFDIIKVFIVFSFIAVISHSCYRDLSTEATITIPDIEFENTDTVYNVGFNSVLTVDPGVSQEGRVADDFSYLWEVTLNANNEERVEISNEPILNYTVANSPSDKPYYLILYVTDNQTGLETMRTWKFYVSSLLGEGLLVAHTRDEGQTSELDFVASERVTYGFEDKEPQYKRNLYSEYNSAPYSGVINTMCCNSASSTQSWDTNRLLLGSDYEVFSIDISTSMEKDLINSELFSFFNESEYKVDYLSNFTDYNTGIIVDNMFYNMTCILGSFFSPVSFNLEPQNIFTKENLSFVKDNSSNVVVMDNTHDNFYYAQGAFLGVSASFSSCDITPSFDISSSEALAAGALSDRLNAFVIKTDTGEYKLLTFDNSAPPVYMEYSLNAPDIENAISFAFCENTSLFYYTTQDAVYTNIVAGSSVTTRKIANFTPEGPDEKITDIIHYQQAWFGMAQHSTSNDYEFILDTHQTQMLIVTYNETTGEGKIYVKPFNVNSGLFSMTDQGEVYDGFGEITAITPTFR